MLHALVVAAASLLAPGDVVTFGAPDFPALGIERVVDVPGADVAATVDELNAALKTAHVLVWRHGAAIPAGSWTAIREFLLGGGRWVHLGGEPWTHVITGGPGAWRVEARSVSILKELRLNQSRVEPVAGAAVRSAGGEAGPFDVAALPEGATVSILEPRFTGGKVFPDEDGSPGSREAVAHPIAFVHQPWDDARFPCASAAFAIDRLSGRFAGGRWALRLLSTLPSAAEIAALIAAARRDVIDVRIVPTSGCFGPEEAVTATVYLRRAGAAAQQPLLVSIDTSPRVRPHDAPHSAARFGPGTDLATVVSIHGGGTPGRWELWTIPVDGVPSSTSGFWVMDDTLFRSGATLTFDHQMLRKDGKPAPVVGTTFMSPSVHRDFLFEPNVREWDDAFATFASLNINLVRTGLWSGWSRAAEPDGTPKESFLRALEAYYLAARTHDVAVLFNAFAFMPPRFGCENAYLDPKSVAAQERFVGGIAARFKGCKQFMIDLINEPSFCAESQLWKARPNGDRFEREAFKAWLAKTFARADGSWEDEVRSRWRLLPDEPIELPTQDDFGDGTTFGTRRPYRAQDWLRFANDAFRDWCFAMRTAIRDAGSSAAITVGQDEGGLLDRPHPQIMADALEFTSMHTWWWNDRLVFDGLAAKRRGKPLLISETGVMNRELLNGEPLRSLDDARDLLEKKLAAAFASGAFGVVQWCWDVNPYMASDNECAIGIHRVDGSYKPEWKALARVAEFVHSHRDRFDGYVEPSTVVVMPDADRFSPRSLEALATVHASERNGSPVGIVLEPLVAQDLANATRMILPSCPGIADSTWHTLLERARADSVVLTSGYFETDEVGRDRPRLGSSRTRLGRHSASGTELPRAIAESNFGVIDHDTIEWHVVDGARIGHTTVPIDWSARVFERRVFGGSFPLPVFDTDFAGADVKFEPFGITTYEQDYGNARLLVRLFERTGDSQGAGLMEFRDP